MKTGTKCAGVLAFTVLFVGLLDSNWRLATAGTATSGLQPVRLAAAVPCAEGMRGRSDPAAGANIPIGRAVELQVDIANRGYLYMLFVDPHGLVEVSLPDLTRAGNFVSEPGGQILNRENVPEVMTARPPVGSAKWYAVYVPQALRWENFPPSDGARHQIFDAAHGAAILAAVQEQIAAQSNRGAWACEFSLHVAGIAADNDYAPQDIVKYFTETTRGVEKPRLDVYINFKFNTADITPDSLPRLDTWGRVLSDPLMKDQIFVVGGHTDDVGTEEYNRALSQRRADAVRDLLIAQYGISSRRLETAGYGKSRPLLGGETPEARAANRRVEFERRN